MAKTVRGMIVPLATPLEENGRPDLAAVSRLASIQIAAGIDVLFVLGTTSEFYGFTLADRRRILETVCEAADGRVPVIVGVSADSTPAAVETLGELRLAAVDGFVASTPYFMGYSQAELARHFLALADAAGGPVILYNYPGRYRHLIEIDTIAGLLARGAVSAIKDTDGDFTYMLRLLELKRQYPAFGVFEGALQNLDRAGRLAIDGSVQAIANLWPEECAALWRQVGAGDWPVLEAGVKRLWKFHRDIEGVAVFIRALKGAMALRGFSSAAVVAPMVAVDEAGLARLRVLMDGAYPGWGERG